MGHVPPAPSESAHPTPTPTGVLLAPFPCQALRPGGCPFLLQADLPLARFLSSLPVSTVTSWVGPALGRRLGPWPRAGDTLGGQAGGPVLETPLGGRRGALA